MNNKTPLRGLAIRSAVVIDSEYGFIYACNLKQERKGIPHTITFAWDAGNFEQGEINYDAHSLCVIEHPESGVVDISEPGYFSVNSESGMVTEDIFVNSHPPTQKRRARGIRSVSEIKGVAYAVGIRGMVYRLDRINQWTRIDDGLPETFDIHAIHGFSGSDIYAVGNAGEMWHFNGKIWTQKQLPTNCNLTSIKCGKNGFVYIAGHRGVLLKGALDQWDIVDHGLSIGDIWDIECFKGDIWISTMSEVYKVENDKLIPADFGEDHPSSCYQLSATPDVMWSNGEYDIMAFDGLHWSRIV